MSIFIIAFMAVLGAMAAVAVAPILMGILLLFVKVALVLGLVFAARWGVLKVIDRFGQQQNS